MATRTRRRTPKSTHNTKQMKKKMAVRPKTKKSRKGKRPLNGFFKEMLKAKKNGDDSFTYNGAVYVGHKHDRLGMIYKKK